MPGNKSRSKYARKRKFVGLRRQDIKSDDDNEERPNENDSRPGGRSTPDKLNRSFEKISENCPILKSEREQVLTRQKAFNLGLTSTVSHPSTEAFGNKIINSKLLDMALEKIAICKMCKSSNGSLKLFQVDRGRSGLDESLYLECQNCHYSVNFHTTEKVDCLGKQHSEINLRLTQAGFYTGNGQTNLHRLCGMLDLPPPVNNSSYNDHVKDLELISAKVAENSMAQAAFRLKSILKVKEEACKNLDVEEDVFPIAVSVDGTWQKRYGHSSLHGVVFVMAVETGEVLDYEVKSKVCFECKARAKWDKESEKFKSWFDKHKNKCLINHTLSSEAMEKEAAITIFKRSVEKHKLKYTTYVGDGDSSSFSEVSTALFEEYGSEYQISKEDCIGHIQKRMGSNLRKYKNKSKGRKLEDGATVGGHGRVTDVVIDSIQNYYGLAIRNNLGNVKAMENAIWAIFFHMIKCQNEDIAVQHKFCPSGKDSWCKYPRDITSGTNTYKPSKCLPNVFRNELKPIFVRLSEKSLLQRCLKGYTQNQNEALNNILWNKCPKRVFCGNRKMNSACANAVLIWNQGAGSQINLLKAMGITEPGVNTIKLLTNENAKRIFDASRKCKSSYQKRRRTLRHEKKKGTKTGEHYSSGAFSCSKPASQRRSGKKRNISLIEKPSEREVEIEFVNEESISVSIHPAKKRRAMK